MYQFRTDALSVALIAGGAAFSGGATLLMASSGTEAAEASECSHLVSHTQIEQRVVVSVGGDANAFVVTPGMTGRAEECAPVAHLADMSIERVQAQVQEAMARAEQVQERARERALRANDRTHRVAERIARAQERQQRARERVGFDQDFDFDFDFNFDDLEFDVEFDGETLVIDLEGMEDFTIDMRGLESEMEELGRELEREFGELEKELEFEMGDLERELEGLGRELEAQFGDLERDFGDAGWEELSSEERDQIERRVEEAMRTLQDRLSRIGDRSPGGSF